jgi:hypothetical protein
MLRKSDLFVVPFIFLVASCSKDEVVVEPGSSPDAFSIDAMDFATNYYFVDTSYAAAFPRLFSGTGSLPSDVDPLLSVEVWAQRVGSTPDPNEVMAAAIVDLPRTFEPYSSQLRNVVDVPGQREIGRVVRLNSAQYSLPFAGRAGIVALRRDISEYAFVAVSYRSRDTRCGESLDEFPIDLLQAGRPILLKLVKPRNLFANGEAYAHAWRLLLKNVYATGFHNIDRQKFQLHISYHHGGPGGTEWIAGHRLLFLLGLDRADRSGAAVQGGDGEFDFVPGVTIDRDYGEIIIPMLRPFDDGLKQSLISLGVQVTLGNPVLVPAVYDSGRAVLSITNRGIYTLSGEAVHYEEP